MTAPQLTPQQLFDQLLSELSASGSVPINANTDENPNTPNLTLRQAIASLYWQQLAAVQMEGTDSQYGSRPFPMWVTDNQLGHILSMRAEVLECRALLRALCEQANPPINVDTIVAGVRASFTPPKSS
jgi:hypothetical protein